MCLSSISLIINNYWKYETHWEYSIKFLLEGYFWLIYYIYIFCNVGTSKLTATRVCSYDHDQKLYCNYNRSNHEKIRGGQYNI